MGPWLTAGVRATGVVATGVNHPPYPLHHDHLDELAINQNTAATWLAPMLNGPKRVALRVAHIVGGTR